MYSESLTLCEHPNVLTLRGDTTPVPGQAPPNEGAPFSCTQGSIHPPDGLCARDTLGDRACGLWPLAGAGQWSCDHDTRRGASRQERRSPLGGDLDGKESVTT
jgi:hypothetical protein